MDADVNNVRLEYNPRTPLPCFARMTNITIFTLLPMLACLLLTGSFALPATASTGLVRIEIGAEIVMPPCLVNNGNTVEVNFGDISITDVSNAKHQKVISVPVTCTYYQGKAYVKFTGTMMNSVSASDYGTEDNVLSTNIPNFGIALYQGSGTVTPLMLGNGSTGLGYEITNGLTGGGTATENFTFTAKPYKQGTAVLKTGAFTASANMSISYQ